MRHDFPPTESETSRALERTRSGDARERYDAAVDLAKHPSELVARRLVELLSDEGSGILDPGTAAFDDDPAGFSVAGAAAESLTAMPVDALPVVLAELPAAAPGAARSMLRVFTQYPPDALGALPDETIARMIDWAERVSPGAPAIANLRWERDLARRVRAGELADPEQYWSTRLERHPCSNARGDAIAKLMGAAHDPAAFAERMVLLLRDPSSSVRYRAAVALRDLPLVLSESTVRSLASVLSQPPYRRLSSSLLPALARYGEPAAPMAPFCVDLLRESTTKARVLDVERKAAATALQLLGSAAEPVRATLIELLFSENRSRVNMYEPVREFVCRALGDPRRLADEVVPRIREALAGRPDGEKEGDAQRTRDACAVLAHVGPHAGHLMPELLPHLDPSGPYDVVMAAAWAAGSMGESGRPAVPRLVALLDVRALRSWAALALSKLGPVVAADAIPVLRALHEQLGKARAPRDDIGNALAAMEKPRTP